MFLAIVQVDDSFRVDGGQVGLEGRRDECVSAGLDKDDYDETSLTAR